MARLDIKMRQPRVGRTEYYIDLIEFYRPSVGPNREDHFLRRWWVYSEGRWVKEVP